MTLGSWEGWDPPEGTQGWSDWHWWKIPTGKVLQLVVLSRKPLGYSGHFHRGRMCPCYGEGCQLCREGIGAQLRYVVGAADLITRRVGMWDMGRSVGLELRELAVDRDSVRGLMVAAGHYSRARQSRTEIERFDGDPPGWIRELESPDICRALVETWRKAGFEIPDGMQAAEQRSIGKNRVSSKVRDSLQGP